MIEYVDFNTIYPIWKNYLWPDRKSPIESHSAMLLNHKFDLKNFNYNVDFFLYRVDGDLAGCNSGHMCCDNTYRSRGLFVFPQYRKQGIGTDLLKATIHRGFNEGATHVWSYPRYESWNTYNSAGFKLVSQWEQSETGTNAFCKI